MSGKYPPLEHRDVVKGLKSLGFEPRAQKSTSHEHWVKFVDGCIRKVTVDKPKSPYGPMLIASMCKQAGVTKDEFYRHCRGEADPVPAQ